MYNPSKLILLLPFLLGAASLKFQDKYSHLVGYWPLVSGFTQSSTIATNRSAYNGPGVLTGTPPTFTASEGVAFNGTNDYVNIPDIDQYTFNTGGQDQPVTMCLWAKLVAATSRPFIAKRLANSVGNQEYYFGTISGNQLYVAMYDGTLGNTQIDAYSSVSMATYIGVWAFYCFTYDGSEAGTGLQVWVNATDITVTQRTVGSYTGMTNTSADLTIAKSLTSYGYFSGQEVLIWSEQKSQSDLEIIYGYGRESIDIKMDATKGSLKVSP